MLATLVVWTVVVAVAAALPAGEPLLSYRLAIVALVFVVVGFALLSRVDVAAGARAVGNEVPSVV